LNIIVISRSTHWCIYEKNFFFRILAINILSKQYFFLHWIGIDYELFQFLIQFMYSFFSIKEGKG